MKLPDNQRQRIITRHFQAIQDRGYEPTALFWENRQVQQLRFNVLWQLLFQHPRFQSPLTEPINILDVGCGFGDFADWLSSHFQAFDYLGIDLSPDMIFAAQCQYPKRHFQQGEIFDFDWEENQFDFVICSGALNEVVEPMETQGQYAKAVIQKLVELAKYGVSLNLLNQNHDWTASRPDLQSFDPEQMRHYCQTLVSNVEMRDDYLANDFSLYLEVNA
ncbi:SAM-dependent methyltransferase [Hydrogenovibrio sp. SC-1]|uniref:class I SAM-dependent methyltransferase n=1 Tax=Hydrogenovibrio sp. SC-1 TaxID=2065820 RepID=UPI000C7DFCB5|nr:class I SAM-dependent methyltransferase [Hydrogenovibrio sp. SC-1]PLA74744.1 SAM-dependent methyltransferase [Hydrogenovibrio sp. SC-1]